ncbi:MAG: NAD(P)/FAD-dependent oxidoreductase [Deltaproteobacteria bacterium]|nr:NAD(P)/FAD-dependent oxidoreductase [Deltaproteobacteria bacterium]
MRQYVILGCGPAGCAAAKEIRAEDPGSKVTLVSREFTPFYLRPILADFVAGSVARAQLVAQDPLLLGDTGVEVKAGARVSRVFPHESRVLLSEGTSLYFDRLLLATGASPRLSAHAARLRHKVQTLASLADAVRIARAPLSRNAVVLVSGEGHPGLEAVRALAKRGCRVVYLTSHTRFWSPRSPVPRSQVLQKLVAEKVEVLFDEAVLDVLDLNGEGYRVLTSSRRNLDVELVVEAGELAPSTEYLEGSGVVVDHGVVVDLELRTNFENVYAAGDVAQVFDDEGNWHRSNFGWESAGRQGLVGGYNLVHGAGKFVSSDEPFFGELLGAKILDRWAR